MLAEILRVHPDEPEQERIEYIVSCLRSGKVVGVPTDTFYGLAVDPVNLMAVERIYEISRTHQTTHDVFSTALLICHGLAPW